VKKTSQLTAKIFVTSIVALGACTQANAFINGEIVRISNNSNALQSFANTADLVAESNPILDTTSPSGAGYANDGWFYLDGLVYRTTGSDEIFSYNSQANFLAGTGILLGSVTDYRDDEFFTYDFGGQEKIVRVSDGDNVTIYDTVTAFIDGSGTSANNDFAVGARGNYDDDGYYSWQGEIFRVGNGSGQILKYANWNAFLANDSTELGAVAAYAHDGFFVVPEPSTYAAIFGVVALSFAMCRRRIAVSS